MGVLRPQQSQAAHVIDHHHRAMARVARGLANGADLLTSPLVCLLHTSFNASSANLSGESLGLTLDKPPQSSRRGSSSLCLGYGAQAGREKAAIHDGRQNDPRTPFSAKENILYFIKQGKKEDPLRSRILKSAFEKANATAASLRVTLHLGSPNPLFLPKYENLPTSETRCSRQ